MKTLWGKPVARALMEAATLRVRALVDRGIEPKLVVVRVGDDPADAAYMRGIARRSEETGLGVQFVELTTNVPHALLEQLLDDLSADPLVHGVLLLRPLPPTLVAAELFEHVVAAKDVDGMSETNLGRLFCGNPLGVAPATARAVVELLDHYGFDVAGRSVCVLGRSLVAGRPIQALLTARDATVALCHSRTVDLGAVCRRAELVVSAVGRAGFVTPEMVAPEAWVVDVGVNAAAGGGIVGDVDPAVANVVKALTPVPGGLGVVTSAALVLQCVEAAERQAS